MVLAFRACDQELGNGRSRRRRRRLRRRLNTFNPYTGRRIRTTNRVQTVNVHGDNTMVGSHGQMFILENLNLNIQMGERHQVSTDGARQSSPAAESTSISDEISQISEACQQSEPVHNVCTPLVSRTTTSGILRSPLYYDIVNTMLNLQQKGCWDELELKYKQYDETLTISRNSALKIILQIYYGIGICLHQSTEKVEMLQIVSNCKALLRDCAENVQLLEGKILIFEGFLAIKEKKFDVAQEKLQKAWQVLESIGPCAFKGECLYDLVCVSYNLLSDRDEASSFKSMIDMVKKAIDYMMVEPEVTHYLRQIATMKIVIIALDCDALHGRCNPMSPERTEQGLKLADEYLPIIDSDKELKDNMSNYTECYRLDCKAQYFYRRNINPTAILYGNKSLTLAKEKGFNCRIRCIEAFLHHIQSSEALDPPRQPRN